MVDLFFVSLLNYTAIKLVLVFILVSCPARYLQLLAGSMEVDGLGTSLCSFVTKSSNILDGATTLILLFDRVFALSTCIGCPGREGPCSRGIWGGDHRSIIIQS